MDNVFVPDNMKLAKGHNFETTANKVLEHSRLFVAWVSVGMAAGAVEAAHKYTQERY